MPRSLLQTAQHLAIIGKLADAERACRQALRAKPNDPQTLRLLGRLTRQTGKAAESVRVLQELVRARPNDLQLLGELGASLTEANMAQQAIPILRRAVQAMPKAAEWQVWLGRAHLKLFETTAALPILREAMALAPDDPEAALQTANALLLVSDGTEAEVCARRALALKPGWIPAMTALAAALAKQSRLDEQMAVLREILALTPPGGSPQAATLAGLAKCLRALNRRDEALALLEPLVARQLSPELAHTLAPLYLAQRQPDKARELLERALALEPMPVPVRASLQFALGEALRQLNRHDDAFLAFQRGNDAYPRTFNREHKARAYETLREIFDASAMRDAPRATIDASRCVFIVGMPRSGTTLVEQIIDAHPRAHGCGELTELQHAIAAVCAHLGRPAPECFTELTTDALNKGAQHYLDAVTPLAPDAARLTDKMPHNFEMLGMIDRMLPGSRVISCSRHPVDNCLSLYFTQLSAWHAYTNNLSDLAWAYAQHLTLMEHWKRVCTLPILEVRYEDMVADTEANARRIIEFVGLEWDDRCLRFYESDRPVTTASVDQVRKPIYTTSVARWRRYEHHLGPLIESLRAEGVEVPEGGE